MCGIAGIINLNGRPCAESEVRALTRSIAHRGPDGEGVYVRDHLGLGHRRLAILDLSEAGRQPMSYAEGRYWLTYNGEIYNFLELRHELEGKGYSFRTQSDTEVILAAYDCWGAECQFRFNGMWAFAIWDSHQQTLFISRDRFGIKPLFYTAENGRFAFASELKAFLHLDGFQPRENKWAIRSVLVNAFSLEATEETLLEGVKRLPAGHCLTVRTSGLKVWRWWSTLDHLKTAPASLSEQVEQFRELFFDSCRLRLRSDVPVGTCLSGGVDSSAVLCTLAEISKEAAGQDSGERRAADWQRAFVATFPGTPADESRYAEIAIRHAGAKAQYRPMSADQLLGDLERVIYDFEDIYLTLPSPAWAIYRELRRDGVVVSLDGHGADEMLGGYAPYADIALRATGGFLRSPLRTWELMNTLYNLYAPDGPAAQPNRLRMMLKNDPILNLPERGARTLYRKTLKPLRRRYGNGTTATSQGEPWVEDSPFGTRHTDAQEERAIDALGTLNAHLYRDFHHSILPTILRNFDRCSMSHGIEVRMPFMDWRLVCFVFSLPEESKIGGGYTKRVLREAMRGVMPESLRTRKGKIGFNSPLPDWLNGPLKGWMLDQVRDRDFLQSDLWNGPAVSDYVESKSRAGAWTTEEAARVWSFLHAHVWRQIFCK